MRIAVLCGGPSAERGISLNSARSVMDHLTPLGWEIAPYYLDTEKRIYALSPAQLYSNTPSDFDFKLKNSATPLSEVDFVDALRKADVVFPAIHGTYGEDGALQELLEKNNIPFVGSPSVACRLMFDKAVANAHLASHGFATQPNCRVHITDDAATVAQKVANFFVKHHIRKAVVKPSAGGSSLGIAMVKTPAEAIERAQMIFDQKHGDEALIEPFCDGQEFTILVLQNAQGQPVALLPTEISLSGGDLFTFRHKYLPTCHVDYHCPPRFSDTVVGNIQKAAEVLFSFFGMRDFARLDGWLMKDGRVIFSDFNPISGMEQNSFLFIQGSRLGLTHSDMLKYIAVGAAKRCGVSVTETPVVKQPNAQKVRVLFGGKTAERQVSLMSGTNVWLKLRHAPTLAPEPYILTAAGDVWQLPYSYTLNHTVEEILARCAEAEKAEARLRVLVPPLRARLGLPPLTEQTLPRRISFAAFCEEARNENAFVFLALHGGEGENGIIQAALDHYGIPYNGSGPEASRLCMDKEETGAAINALGDATLIAAPKITFSLADGFNPRALWQNACLKFQTESLLIKPQSDGCSAGVARLESAEELALYLNALTEGQSVLPPDTLRYQPQPIELPQQAERLMLEPFIVTDVIRIDGLDLRHEEKTGWLELTVGVLEDDGVYQALSPSITVAQDSVLSLEEKFQGGTGVNLTPPPESIICPEQVARIRAAVARAAKTLGIEGYARLDLFFNTRTGQTLLIEANSLPGLTASTVIFHQALAEQPSLSPRAFLAKLVARGIKRRDRQAVASRLASQ